MPITPHQMPTWQETAHLMQQYRDESIAALEPPVPTVPSELPLNVTALPSQLLSSSENTITTSSPEHLLASLASGTLLATTVTNAFLRRAALAQTLTNCITELLPSAALARAKYLDDYYAEHKKPIGPLHGLPISVKEHIAMKDLDINCGYISRVGTVGTVQSTILQILWKAGCVFYARTTQPQTLMHLECSSNLYGVTVNPYNRALTSGGSSGGEGALLGIKGSCLGIGSDIGGSIRSPAANNGVFGLRPTSYRLPVGGWQATMGGQEGVIAVIGPLSTSLEGVKVFMKTIIDAEPWLLEPSLVPLPWRWERDWLEKPMGKKVRVGVLWDDGVVKPHPPVLRAMRELVGKLEGVEEIEVVDWTPYKHDWAWKIIMNLYFADNGAQTTDAINSSGEPWRPLSRHIVADNPTVHELSITELWTWTLAREQYRTEYAKLLLDTGVDVILCPVGPGAAPLLDHAKYWGYTAQWNILDWPAVVFPAGKVVPEVDGREEGYQPRNEKDEFNYGIYDPEKYRDAPVSLQLVGRRYEDEKVLQALEFIQSKVGGLPLVPLD
ncbi:amidase [Aulographum hederae CBS 113979]|uniref:amidase n=1 Tax=Aulographum hederae CBS 113979 TaxID=1176131 RepID=A0A6G1GNY6_9PEZI|nr:amidase [Aulographum hederae CBS 113979]